MAKHGVYRCAFNEWWTELTSTMTLGVPYNRAAIKTLAEGVFSEPGQYNGVNIVIIHDLSYNPLEHKRLLEVVVP